MQCKVRCYNSSLHCQHTADKNLSSVILTVCRILLGLLLRDGKGKEGGGKGEEGRGPEGWFTSPMFEILKNTMGAHIATGML